MMKKMIRLTSLLLALLMVSATLLSCVGVYGETDAQGREVIHETKYNYAGETTDVTSSIVSEFRNVFNGTDIKTSWISNHGGGQTRMVSTPTGVYYTLFTTENSDYDPLEFDIIHLKDDGTSESVYHTTMPYTASGPCPNIMVDANGVIWVYSGWATEKTVSTKFEWVFNLYKYNPADGTTKHIQHTVNYKNADALNYGGGGYGTSAIDLANNCILCITNVGNKPGCTEWSVFDIATETFGEMHTASFKYRYCYTYILPDGVGGYHLFNQRDVQVTAVKTDYGKNVEVTSHKFFSNWYENNMLFDEWDYFHIIGNQDGCDTQFAVEEAVYQYQKGLYPDCRADSSDIFMDSQKNLHFIYNCRENNTYGTRNVHVVYSTQGGAVKEIYRQTMHFAGSSNCNYYCRMFEDTTGALYMVCIRDTETPFEIEIFGASNATSEMKLLYAEERPTAYGLQPAGTAIATSRNGSIMSDVLHMAVYSYQVIWWDFTIDFAQLRTFINR